MHEEYWLEIELFDPDTGKKSYAGNVDEVVSCVLFGFGHERYGEDIGVTIHEKLGFDKCGHVYLIESFAHEEYGSIYYDLGDIDYNHIKFKIARGYGNSNELSEFIARIKDLEFEWMERKYERKIKIGKIWKMVEKIEIVTELCGHETPSIPEVKMVSIAEKEYENLKDDSLKLRCLEAGGVDNWEWYGESLREGGYFED